MLRHAILRLFHKLNPDLTLDQRDALEVQGVKGSKFLDIWREISEACALYTRDSYSNSECSASIDSNLTASRSLEILWGTLQVSNAQRKKRCQGKTRQKSRF